MRKEECAQFARPLRHLLPACAADHAFPCGLPASCCSARIRLPEKGASAEATIKRMETSFGSVKVQKETCDRLLQCFEREGITLSRRSATPPDRA
jgi:hypothetical protein